MVGNYLQTLNWKEDVQLMRQIENFYVKANAFDLLASFYEACAQVIIKIFDFIKFYLRLKLMTITIMIRVFLHIMKPFVV